MNVLFAPTLGSVPPNFQTTMTRLLELVEAGDEAGAVDLAQAWFDDVDGRLVKLIEGALGASERQT